MYLCSMQTFLPYSDIEQSLEVLDNKRLGKQRVEAYQIISAITSRPKLDGTPYKGWLNHPCSVMWRHHVPLLKHYYNMCIDEWVLRGFKNSMKHERINEEIEYPVWWGNQLFHDSHKSNLLRKDLNHYSQFGWNLDPSDPYVWMDDQGNWYKQMVGEKKRIYLNLN